MQSYQEAEQDVYDEDSFYVTLLINWMVKYMYMNRQKSSDL